MFAAFNRLIRREYRSLDITVEHPTSENTEVFFIRLAAITHRTGPITRAFCGSSGYPVGCVQLHRAGGDITIHRIWTVYPKRGFGSRILRKVCRLAARHGVYVKLKIAPLGTVPHSMPAHQLQQWYHRTDLQDQQKLPRVPSSPQG